MKNARLEYVPLLRAVGCILAANDRNSFFLSISSLNFYVFRRAASHIGHDRRWRRSRCGRTRKGRTAMHPIPRNTALTLMAHLTRAREGSGPRRPAHRIFFCAGDEGWCRRRPTKMFARCPGAAAAELRGRCRRRPRSQKPGYPLGRARAPIIVLFYPLAGRRRAPPRILQVELIGMVG
jgi:hypothetical protein